MVPYRHDNPSFILPSLEKQSLNVKKDTTVKDIKNHICSKLNQKDIVVVLTYKSLEISDNHTLSEVLKSRGTQNDSKFDMNLLYYKNVISRENEGNMLIKKEEN